MTSAIITSVLIVDATPTSAEALQSILHANGYHVTKAVNGGERALAEMRQSHPDIVCAELVNLDEAEMGLLAAMHEEFPQTPLVVVSGNSDRDQVKKAIALGASGFILLPFAAAEVQATFRRLRKPSSPHPPTSEGKAQ